MFTMTARTNQPPKNPTFMFGDMDAMNPVSAISLGEACLAAQKNRHPASPVARVHRHAGPAAGGNGAFMHGAHPEQPATVAQDDLTMGLWISEQA